ncbi:unnamed protein product [Gordionus sp. m RMFG-2023]
MSKLETSCQRMRPRYVWGRSCGTRMSEALRDGMTGNRSKSMTVLGNGFGRATNPGEEEDDGWRSQTTRN